MLRFVRPKRSERLVWVDALCINQDNFQERGVQVAIMGRIYEDCSRVIVYLGNDIVTDMDSFPFYKSLPDLDDISSQRLFPKGHPYHNQMMRLSDILNRKYFTRIWMIQELVYSERAIVRIGNTDFRLDSSIMSSYIRQKEPDLSTAPWVAYLGQKTLFHDTPYKYPVDNEKDLVISYGAISDEIYEVFNFLCDLSQSQASDPRDRLFGVISMISTNYLRYSFELDYSISNIHFYIGLFGYFILNNHMIGPLCAARTISKPSYIYPSWLPECDSTEEWRNVFRDREHFTFGSKIDHQQIWCAHIPNAAEQYLLKDRLDSSFISAFGSSAFMQDPWYNYSYIDRESGSLNLPLGFLFTFSSQPALATSYTSGEFAFTLRDSHEHYERLLMVSNEPLDDLISPNIDHLFVLEYEKGSLQRSLMYCILCQDRNTTGSFPTYRLVTANLHLFLVYSCMRVLGECSREPWGEHKFQHYEDQRLSCSVFQRTVAGTIGLAFVQMNEILLPSPAWSDWVRDLDQMKYLRKTWIAIVPISPSSSNLLPIFFSLYRVFYKDEHENSSHNLIEEYLNINLPYESRTIILKWYTNLSGILDASAVNYTATLG
ncbi:heterokaryon incompatibility protein-domain-containing protein [Dendryphion nanum]|uniref:Heterokaryon incompatibility protein-domain-containing protein n=1 Tax=Dendryphion nanum TaxID=256645 RepID=A0A9P9IGA6_9PLEO|nr:heterokaryon incompatibility protein-domain-containing protein [Dendryphion nanum]